MRRGSPQDFERYEAAQRAMAAIGVFMMAIGIAVGVTVYVLTTRVGPS